MRQATKSGVAARPRTRRITAGAGGERHPLQNVLTAFTLAAGVVAFATGFVVRQHVLATSLGLAALVVGLYAQMVSATRVERILIVTGLVAAFVGVSLGLAHGSFGT